MGCNIGFNFNNNPLVPTTELKVHRGEIYMAEMHGVGSIQDGTRPVVVVQNDLGNKFSLTTIVVYITSRKKIS